MFIFLVPCKTRTNEWSRTIIRGPTECRSYVQRRLNSQAHWRFREFESDMSASRKRLLEAPAAEEEAPPHRDCDRLCASAATVHCALHHCIPCAYKIGAFDVALDASFCKVVPNQRPELCPRAKDQGNTSPVLGYGQGMKVLTVGDGDFSFSLALARFGCKVVATSYESKETVRKVYSSVHIEDTLAGLESLGAVIAYGVDATNLKGTLPTALANRTFQRIVWNFPCSAVAKGQDGQNQEMEQNKKLVRDFVNNARIFCNDRIYINHKTKPPFNQWKIDEVVVSAADTVRYLGRVVLDRHLFPPYVPRKALDRKSFPCHDACTYIFDVIDNRLSTSDQETNQLGALDLPDNTNVDGMSSSTLIAVTPDLIRALRMRFLQEAPARHGNQTKGKRKKKY
jgi:Domain of unknown function (DUF2431)